MVPISILAAGQTDALQHARHMLKQQGFSVLREPDYSVTHLLLPVPSFEADGRIKGGGSVDMMLDRLPKDITIIGGNLEHPALTNYKKVDLLQDAGYLAMNARITAYCAISLAMQVLPRTLDRLPVLVIGWGRIGKCLAQLLAAIGADVTVAARKETDRASLASLGYQTTDICGIDPAKYALLYNTAPQMVMPDCNAEAYKIDLASKPGIGASDVAWARGLPNKLAPESSGQLIADTVISYLSNQEAML